MKIKNKKLFSIIFEEFLFLNSELKLKRGQKIIDKYNLDTSIIKNVTKTFNTLFYISIVSKNNNLIPIKRGFKATQLNTKDVELAFNTIRQYYKKKLVQKINKFPDLKSKLLYENKMIEDYCDYFICYFFDSTEWISECNQELTYPKLKKEGFI